MRFETLGEKGRPAVLFFHAMGVVGESSEPVAQFLRERYFCVMPTSSVYCAGERYVSKEDEIRQVEDFLRAQGVRELALVVSSSLGADLAAAFLAQTKLPVGHAYFDGGQFVRIKRSTRRLMTPFLYLAIKSLWWTRGGTLKKILWCDDAAIRPYFIAAGQALRMEISAASWGTVSWMPPSPPCRRRCRRAASLPSAARRTTSSTAPP